MLLDPPRVTVFCGSQAGLSPRHAEAARALGRALVRRGLGLVTGGGRVGLMGVVADAVLEAGGEALGVIPRLLATRELAHDGMTHLHVVETMHERKALMAALGGAFVALPGGMGTLEELFEVLTWAQLGIHHKPVGVLDVDGFWAPLSAFLDHQVAEGFLRPPHRGLLLRADDPEALLDLLERGQPPGATPAAPVVQP
ncbi:MAG: TIGR00730 family Rossman fold protein [Planctomycetes bacterium]|nr:TIGR00730 family Rossman fold protein [Planctomycetota bacterium]